MSEQRPTFPILVPFPDWLARFESLGELVAAYVDAVTEAERLRDMVDDARHEGRIPADPTCEDCNGSGTRIVMIGFIGQDAEPMPVACGCIRTSPEPTHITHMTAF